VVWVKALADLWQTLGKPLKVIHDAGSETPPLHHPKISETMLQKYKSDGQKLSILMYPPSPLVSNKERY